MCILAAERQAEGPKQFARLVVCAGLGTNRNVHALHAGVLIWVELRENELLAQRFHRTHELEALGHRPYGSRFDYTHTVPQAHQANYAWVSLGGALRHELAHYDGSTDEPSAYRQELAWYQELKQSALLAGLKY